MEKRKGKFGMRAIYFIAVIAVIFGVKFWLESIPPKIESGETLVFHDGYTSDGKLKVWYPLEKRLETYAVGESLHGISFVDKDTILAISVEREAVLECNLNNHSFTEICSLKSIAESFSQESGINACPNNFYFPEYVGEKYLVLEFESDPDALDSFSTTFLYNLQDASVSFMEKPYLTLLQYQIGATNLIYVDAITHGVVGIDGNNPSRKTTHRIYPTISHDGTMRISDNHKLISVDTGEVIASFEELRRYSSLTDFTFSSDDQYIAFYYCNDELLYSRQTGHACVYDRKKDRIYNFSTKEYTGTGARIDWIPE